MNPRKPLLYLLALLPGLGHFYLGLMTRGLQFMLLFFGTIFLIVHSFASLALVLPIIVFYSYFDALQFYRMHRDMAELFDEPLLKADWVRRNQHLFGWVLIGLGGLTIIKHIKQALQQYLPQFMPAYIPYDLLQNLIMSSVLVLIGLQVLRTKHDRDALDTIEK